MANFDQYDNLRETFTTTGTGTITVAGSPGGAYRVFSAKLANGYVGIFYARNGTSLGNATQWERWIGTYSTSGTITRTTLLDSSTGSFINWAAGTKIVEISPAPSRVLEAASGYTVSTNSATGGQTLSITSGGGDALTTNGLDQFAATTSAELAGVIDDETGSGALVFADAPEMSDVVLDGSNQVTGRIYTDNDALTDGATITIDFSLGNKFTVTLEGNRTIEFTNTVAGQVVAIRLLQDGTGSRTITWPAGIKWAGGSEPTLTTTADKADWIGLEVVTAGSAYDGFVLSQNH